MAPICGTVMRLVDHDQVVIGEVVEQAVGRLARRASVDVPRVVLDSGAEADLLHHLEVERRAHAEPLRLEQLALALELLQALVELVADRADRALHHGARDVVQAGTRDRIELRHHLSGERVKAVQRLDLVAGLDADRELLVDRDDLDRVAADAERAAGERDVVALVLHGDELADEPIAVDALTDLEGHHGVEVLLWRAEAVDARHAREPRRRRAG